MQVGVDSDQIATVSALSGWVGDCIIYPLDTISTRMKGNPSNETSMRSIIKSLKQHQSLYRGFLLTIPHSFVSSGIYVLCYEGLMRQTRKMVDYSKHIYLKHVFPFFISAAAQVVVMCLELPLDVLRKRVQMSSSYKFTSIATGLLEIYREEGILRFYLSARIFITCHVAYSAIQMQVFETLRYLGGGGVAWSLVNTVLSTVVAVLVVQPLEVLITRYALVDTRLKRLNFMKLVRQMITNQGWQGFYKGWLPQLFIHSIYSLSWIPIYQWLRQYSSRQHLQLH